MSRPKGSKNKKKLDLKTLNAFVQADGFDEAQKVIGKPETSTYKLTLKSAGRVYQSEGLTLEEALTKLKIVGGAKVVSVLKVEHGDIVKERLINASYVQRVFGGGSPTTKAIFIKKIITLYGL